MAGSTQANCQDDNKTPAQAWVRAPVPLLLLFTESHDGRIVKLNDFWRFDGICPD
jgi:hypothetical protein